jgi:hypothetical protein
VRRGFLQQATSELTEPFDGIDDMLYRDSGGELPITVLGLALAGFAHGIVHAAFRRGRHYLTAGLWLIQHACKGVKKEKHRCI